LLVTLGLIAPQGTPEAEAASVPAEEVEVPPVAERPDAVSAMVTARAQGSRVEVLSERTATTSTWVNADGTFTTEVHAAPIRFRDGDAWRDVDLTLVGQADGSVRPIGHPGGLRFGAVGVMASTAEDGAGRQVVLNWDKKLPQPALDDSRATYVDVSPGVDLVLEATRTGFKQSFVVKSRPSGPVSWQIPVKTKGLTARVDPDGSVTFVDDKGAAHSKFVSPLAWDAEIDERSGDPANVSPVALGVTQQEKGRAVISITPDAAWLADPARQFPVTVDPTYAPGTIYPGFDTFVHTGYANTDLSGWTELRVGTPDGGASKARAFLNFPITAALGKQIMSASMSLYETYSYSCNARPINVYASNLASTSSRWGNQPYINPTLQGTLSVAKGYTGCAAGRINIPVTGWLKYWVAAGSANGGMALKASETDSYGWKKFASLESAYDPVLSFTYNRKPNAATAPMVYNTSSTPSRTYGTPAIPYTFVTKPWFRAKATDPDLNTVRHTIEVHSSTAGTAATLKASCTTAYVGSGTEGRCEANTALADNTTYYVRAAVYDGFLWNGTWSPWTTFRTAQTKPAAPTISCPGHANGSWIDTPPGSPVTCTVSTSTT
ncbi:MAG: DNRLRE domain-containing protein, partial [Gammaproteobacteria bacterium]